MLPPVQSRRKLPPAPRAALASLYGLLAYLAWFGLCLALHVVLPGKLAQGTVLADGSRLTYKLNGPETRLLRAARAASPRRVAPHRASPLWRPRRSRRARRAVCDCRGWLVAGVP